MTKIIGRYIVIDSDICHGQPTFRDTRILVSDVLEQVAAGVSWDAIVEDWRGAISKDAISESVRLARDLLVSHVQELAPAAARE